MYHGLPYANTDSLDNFDLTHDNLRLTPVGEQHYVCSGPCTDFRSDHRVAGILAFAAFSLPAISLTP